MVLLNERSPDGPALWFHTPLWAAIAIAVTEAATWLFDLWWYVAGIPLSPSAVLGVAAVLALSRYGRFGASAVPLMLFVVLIGTFSALYAESWAPIVLFFSAASEEATYRVALPLLLASGLRWVHLPRPYPAVVAVAAVAVLFAFLPGHVAQFETSAFGPLPWVGVSVMWTWMLWRGASLGVVVAHHMGMNSAAFATELGAPVWLWPAAIAVPLLLWVLLEGLRDQRLGLNQLLITQNPPLSDPT